MSKGYEFEPDLEAEAEESARAKAAESDYITRQVRAHREANEADAKASAREEETMAEETFKTNDGYTVTREEAEAMSFEERARRGLVEFPQESPTSKRIAAEQRKTAAERAAEEARIDRLARERLDAEADSGLEELKVTRRMREIREGR